MNPVIKIVAKHFQVPASAILQKRGPAEVCKARHMANAILYESGMKHIELALIFNKRDHTTSVISHQTHAELLHDFDYRQKYEAVLAEMEPRGAYQSSSDEAMGILEEACLC